MIGLCNEQYLKIYLFNEFAYIDKIPSQYHKFIDRGNIPLASSNAEALILSTYIKIFGAVLQDSKDKLINDFIGAGFRIDHENLLTDRLILYYPYSGLTEYYLAARMNGSS